MLGWGWPVLLLVTIVNQLPVVSVLMPTEPVYVYLGTQLPGSGWRSLAACVVGAWIGNQGSYWLGRTAGAAVIERMKVGQGAMARARALFDRHGAAFVVASQLIWPIATLAQVMSGAWGMRPLTFLWASGLGAATAAALAAGGARVVALDLPDACAAAPAVEGVEYVPTDVTSQEQVRAAVA